MDQARQKIIQTLSDAYKISPQEADKIYSLNKDNLGSAMTYLLKAKQEKQKLLQEEQKQKSLDKEQKQKFLDQEEKQTEYNKEVAEKYLLLFHINLQNLKKANLSKVGYFDAVANSLAVMMNFMLVQRDSYLYRIEDIKSRIQTLVDKAQNAKPKEKDECIELITQMNQQIKNIAQSNLKNDIDDLKLLKTEIQDLLQKTKLTVEELKTDDFEQKEFQRLLNGHLSGFKKTLKLNQDSLKTDYSNIELALKKLNLTIANSSTLIQVQTKAISQNTETMQALNKNVNQSKKYMEEELLRRDEKAQQNGEQNKQVLTDIETMLIQYNTKAEEVKEASISAVKNSFDTEYQKRKKDVNKVILEESNKINQAVAQAMIPLAKSDEVDKVKTQVDKIVAHVDHMQTTENLEHSINETASKVAADNRNLVQNVVDQGLENAAKKGALKGLEKFNQDRLVQKQQQQALKKQAAEQEEERKAQAQTKKDQEKKDAKHRQEEEKQRRRQQHQSVIASLMQEAKKQTELAQGAITFANQQLIQTSNSIQSQITLVQNELHAFIQHFQRIREETLNSDVEFAKNILDGKFAAAQDQYTIGITKLAQEYTTAWNQLSQVNSELQAAQTRSNLFIEQTNLEADKIKTQAQNEANQLLAKSKEEALEELQNAGKKVMVMGKDHLDIVIQIVKRNQQGAQQLEEIITKLTQATDFNLILEQAREIQEKITQAAKEAGEFKNRNTELQQQQLQLQKNAAAMNLLQDTLHVKAGQIENLVNAFGPIIQRLERSVTTAQQTTKTEKNFVSTEIELLRQFLQKLEKTIEAINQTIEGLNQASAKKFSFAEKELAKIISDLSQNQRNTPTPIVMPTQRNTPTPIVMPTQRNTPTPIVMPTSKQLQKQIQEAVRNEVSIASQSDTGQNFSGIIGKRRLKDLEKDTKTTTSISDFKTANQQPLLRTDDSVQYDENGEEIKVQVNNYMNAQGRGKRANYDTENKESFQNNEFGLQQLDTQENSAEIDEYGVPEVTAEPKSGTGIGTILALGAGLLILTVLLVKYRNRSRSQSRSDSDQ